MYNRLWIFFAVIIFLSSPGNSGQTDRRDTPSAIKKTAVPESSRIPVIRIRTNLVLIPVSVRDAAGRPVADLGIQDFAVHENGNAVQLEYLGKPELTRLDIALVFDLTSSLWFHFDLVKESASGFVKSFFRAGDTVSIIGISSEPQILLKRNGSLAEILEGLNGIRRFGAATAFYDAISASARQFPERADPETRRVLVTLSDGEDNLSRTSLENTMERIQKADAIFYSINPTTAVNRLNRVSLRGQERMQQMAEQTGGTAFLADSFDDLDSIFKTIAEELQVQYLLGYNSPETKTDGRYRAIKVALRDRPELKVRARKGYYAPPAEAQ